FERKRVAGGNDKFSVEQELPLLQRGDHLHDLREIAAQWLARPGSQGHLASVALRKAAEAVPLGLELPAVAFRQLCGEKGLHRRGWLASCVYLPNNAPDPGAVQSEPR